MNIVQQLKQMMEQLINHEYNCNDFSYDFPEAMLQLDVPKIVDVLDDMPEICAAYDPYKEKNEKELLNDDELIAKVKEVYDAFVKVL